MHHVVLSLCQHILYYLVVPVEKITKSNIHLHELVSTIAAELSGQSMIQTDLDVLHGLLKSQCKRGQLDIKTSKTYT